MKNKVTRKDIKQAYGDLYNKLKDGIQGEGWISIDALNVLNFDPRNFPKEDFDCWHIIAGSPIYRPKSLGWGDGLQKRFAKKLEQIHKDERNKI